MESSDALNDQWLVQVWLQEFAWTEKSKPERLEIRNGSMAIEDRATIESEPMFCMETMMNCLYWSLLIYDYEEVQLLQKLCPKCQGNFLKMMAKKDLYNLSLGCGRRDLLEWPYKQRMRVYMNSQYIWQSLSLQ